MKIVFNKTKTHVVFIHEDAREYKFLNKFTAFERSGVDVVVPAVLPVLHNVVERLRRKKLTLKFDPQVLKFLEQDFTLEEIPLLFEYHTKPKDFQEIALRFLYTLGSAGILLDPGMGKSKVVLDYIWLKQFKRSIIVCPLSLLFVWEDEIAKHRPELTYHTITSTDWEVEKAGVLASQVTIINYSKVSLLLKELKGTHFDFIHVDEFLIKDASTNRTAHITEFSRAIEYRCGGSGTLINNSPLDAFAPVRFLQPSLVGPSYYNFVEAYTVQKQVRGTNRKVVVAVKGQDEVKNILESCCIVMTKEKWLKLPPKYVHDIIVPMTTDQRQAYSDLMSNYYLRLPNGREIRVDNQLVMLSKLYQIANGFIYVNDDPESIYEDSDFLLLEAPRQKKPKKKTSVNREVFQFEDSPKEKALDVLLRNALREKKAIIWFNYSGELEQITRVIDGVGAKYLIIKGGEKDVGGKVRAFNKDPSIQWLVCQAQSVNYGITVLGSKKDSLEDEFVQLYPDLDPSVCNSVFYSLSFSLERYLQQMDRIHRLGQDNECNYYRIFSDAPVERKIRQAITDKLVLKNEMLVDVMDGLLTESEADRESRQSTQDHPNTVGNT